MSAPYILDEQLPQAQDYNWLKGKGIDYIHQYSGSEWTNLNSSDPGVTILDQLCYALTELGYCNDFSICDILTDRQGTLQLKDQFYLPEEILTTSPVTINDYRKYIIDCVPGVDNALVHLHHSSKSGIYMVYLMLNPSVAHQYEKICASAFFYLNKRRNLGELFLWPQQLSPVPYLLAGSIEMEKGAEPEALLAMISAAIRNYIFPVVSPTGYVQPTGYTADPDRIFNGPLLQHGWIDSDALGQKKNKLGIVELVQLIRSVPGVQDVPLLYFVNGESELQSLKMEELLAIDVLGSVEAGHLEIKGTGSSLYKSISINPVNAASRSLKPDTDSLFGASVNTQGNLPAGKFRDINTYYSIQNTFPEIFAVGADAMASNAPDFQIAQSQQLKGYLTLFDQVLANQFSQLAGIGKLFSFKNSASGISPALKTSPGYPVPYRSFSPTYYYQPLYGIPNVQPLLKGNNTFRFGNAQESSQAIGTRSWEEYRQDPYNPYIHGLMELMEDESINLARRNEILDHLLARHGESALMIDSVIDATMCTGDSLKGQVIFKSLYLQNLGLLSYFRQKACNFIAATRISAEIPGLSPAFEKEIMDDDTADFMFDTGKTDRVEKLSRQHFSDFSAVELKLSMLFGLRLLYRDYIAHHYKHASEHASEKTGQALWMISQRRGMILIETGLVYQYSKSDFLANPPAKFDNHIMIVFPEFIRTLNNQDFKNRLELFLENTLPVRMTYHYYFAGHELLARLIPLYARWHNCLAYDAKHELHLNYTALEESATALIPLLAEIKLLS
jgi:hypothetical protein